MSGKTDAVDPAEYIRKPPSEHATDDGPAPQQAETEPVRFSPEEEAELLDESHTHKNEANALFASGQYDAAIRKYDEAVSVCPNYLDFELAVLQSNVSACYLKMEDWKNAAATATAALEKLERLEARLAGEEQADAEARVREEEEVEEEIISAGAKQAGPPIPEDEKPDPARAARDRKREDIRRLRYKALIRRARARSEQGGWTNLAGAEGDYRVLAGMDTLSPGDRNLVRQQLGDLPARVAEAKEKETAEMWGKLKDLGNGILRPFGLSTEQFQMVQDPKTGGYSMNFKPQ